MGNRTSGSRWKSPQPCRSQPAVAVRHVECCDFILAEQPSFHVLMGESAGSAVDIRVGVRVTAVDHDEDRRDCPEFG